MTTKAERPTTLLNPTSSTARDMRLTAGAFLREILLAAFLALSLPLGLWLGVMAGLNLTNRLEGLAIFSLLGLILIGGPISFYAALRLHAATIARGRTIKGDDLILHPPFRGPLWSFLPGTTRARLTFSFPVNLELTLCVLSLPGDFATPLALPPLALSIAQLIGLALMLTQHAGQG
ncbi:MAG: hypothetical protein Q4G24_03460 [Paracoccus sp. (in: a-proteobacteria)]|uniref:hypothetical protein n=1 Tax=Paracoccus sp. TaxID=267 RepID=UPI0026DEF417|nr:hypothetical protein [Paracoccus sp. (in: a-proteobacteria)]MDO5620509.1 hypothetical protein [Paracoccus sp. (in: a-proteobacteria)]